MAANTLVTWGRPDPPGSAFAPVPPSVATTGGLRPTRRRRPFGGGAAAGRILVAIAGGTFLAVIVAGAGLRSARSSTGQNRDRGAVRNQFTTCRRIGAGDLAGRQGL